MIVADHIRRAARQFPDRVAAICGGERRSHRELDERSSRFANALLARGLELGERVIVLLENSIRCIEIDFALSKAGLVRVALDPRVTAPELAYILADAEPAALVFGSNFGHLVGDVIAARPMRHVICVEEPQAPRVLAGAVAYEALL